jgi:hypothetical protein
VPQSEHLYHLFLKRYNVIEVIIYSAEQQSSQVSNSPMRHSFAGMRKLLNKRESRLKILDQHHRRAETIASPPAGSRSNVAVGSRSNRSLTGS